MPLRALSLSGWGNAVSYTHLDVYKRQTYTRLKEECISAVHEEALKAFKAGEREM